MSAFQMDLPRGVRLVIDTLHRGGFSAYTVGGCVRDALRGEVPHDYDVTTSAFPEEMLSLFEGWRVIPTGLKHGTLTVLCDGESVEVTTFRVDGEYRDGRHPDSVSFTRDLKADAARRDFTVNAMAYSNRDGLCDFFGGKEDLKAGLIRAVGDAHRRFEEDALRILRALRFASVLGFRIEEETAKALFDCKKLLQKISAERIREEFLKCICGKDAVSVLREYREIFWEILPCLAPLYGLLQHNPWHDKDVWEHTLFALGAIPPIPRLRLAALLHDVGKGETFTRDENGIGHFYGHAERSVAIAEEVLFSLKTDNALKHRVLTLIRWHQTPMEDTDKRVKKMLSAVGEEAFFDLLHLMRADSAAQSEKARPRLAVLDEIEERAHRLLQAGVALTVRDLAVSGADLSALGIPPSPLMGKLLSAALDAVTEGTVANEKEALLEFVKQEIKRNEQ